MKLTASYNPKRDAENHVRAIYDQIYKSYGRADMREKLLGQIKSSAIKEALEQAKTREEALGRIAVELENIHQQNNGELSAKAEKLTNAWEKVGKQIEWQLSFLYQQKFPFEEVVIDLTTIPMCPYDFKAKRIFVHAQAPTQIQLSILAHELNHFMFYFYYPKLRDELGDAKFELLKESLTLFTNPEQTGKPDEMPLRELFMSKSYANLDEAIEDGKQFLSK